MACKKHVKSGLFQFTLYMPWTKLNLENTPNRMRFTLVYSIYMFGTKLNLIFPKKKNRFSLVFPIYIVGTKLNLL
jgi:hypothetical protein